MHAQIKQFLTIIGLTIVLCSWASPGQWGQLRYMLDYSQEFNVSEDGTNKNYKVTLIESSAAGNIFFPNEQPKFTLQVENLTKNSMQGTISFDIIRYALQEPRSGNMVNDMWFPRIKALQKESKVITVNLDIKPEGYQNITITPEISATKGGYAIIAEFEKLGRHYVTSCTRTFKPKNQRIQYSKQSLDQLPPEILERIGIQNIRMGVPYVPTEFRKNDPQKTVDMIDNELNTYHKHKITVSAEFGGSTGFGQPLEFLRRHLDDNNTMTGTKGDIAWLPKYDKDFEEYVYNLCVKHGWPNGAITGVMLWNEPWESASISGWQADIPRYQEIYMAMARGVIRARKDANVDVLLGGCDSTDNTMDKLFSNSESDMLPYLDFCSTHYQNLSVPRYFKSWNERTHHKGRVLVWDTESWVANNDEKFSAAIAGMRAAGYDRTLGSLCRIAFSTLSHRRIGYDNIRTENGVKKTPSILESRPLAAVYSALQEFLGEREFKEILFKNGIPWVYVFDGLNNNEDDGTIVVLGDISAVFAKEKDASKPIFANIRSLDEVNTLKKLYAQLDKAKQDEKKDILEKIARVNRFTNASMSIKADGDNFSLYDYYGNKVDAVKGQIIIPLNELGFYFRANPEIKGSMAKLITAIKTATIKGIEPLNIVALDMTDNIANQPELTLELTNQQNVPIDGTLEVTLADLKLEYPKNISFKERESKVVKVKIIGGQAQKLNQYTLTVDYKTKEHGTAWHREDMRVNLIAERTIKVDGNLSDWEGVLPQLAHASTGASFEELMWAMRTNNNKTPAGVTIGYFASDDDYFYFGAKITDDSVFAGSMRYEKRDDDSFFYPEKSYLKASDTSEFKALINQEKRLANKEKSNPKRMSEKEKTTLKELREKITKAQTQLIECIWPEGVRRYTYRKRSESPWNYDNDNILLAFNAVPPEDDIEITHLAGTMPRYAAYKTTDYEYVFNHVAPQYGGGEEVWRLMVPGVPRIHFYPRQKVYSSLGVAKDAKYAVKYQDGYRYVECAIPWSEIPHVKALKDANKPIKINYRVNNNKGASMDLGSLLRSNCYGFGGSFHPGWRSGAPNELAFGWELTTKNNKKSR